MHRSATALILVLLIMALIAPSLSYGSYVILRIRIMLSNGVPLGNATVTYRYSRVSTQTVINTTDNDGYVELRVNNEWVGDGYHPIIIVSYSFFGEIYRSEFEDVKSIPDTIILPYTLLYRKSIVTDEYLRGLNGSYSLFYNDIALGKGFLRNGLLVINDTIKGVLLLFSIKDNAFNDKYRITLNVNNTLITLHLPVLNDHLIIDLYKPRIRVGMINASMGINEVLYLYANTSIWDGINTNKTTVKGVFTIKSDAGKIVRDARVINKQAHDSYINVFFKASILKASLPPSSDGRYTITFEISAIDPTGKSSRASRSITYFIVNSTGGGSVSNSAPMNNVSKSTSPASYVEEKPGTSNTTTRYSYNSGFGAGVSPGFQTSSLGYFAAPIIAFTVLLFELRRRIREGSASPGSS